MYTTTSSVFPFSNNRVMFSSADVDISSKLRSFADRRTDIFGVEETAIGKKVGEEQEGDGGGASGASATGTGNVSFCSNYTFSRLL